MWSPDHLPTVQMGEICRRLAVRERDARYVLEQGHVPEGVDGAPESGNHRQFGPRQAYWLGMVLKLKAIGIQTHVRMPQVSQFGLRTGTVMARWPLALMQWFDVIR